MTVTINTTLGAEGYSGLTAIAATTSTVATSYATTFDTNVAAAGVTLVGTTLAADGTDANINIDLTPKGTGMVQVNGILSQTQGAPTALTTNTAETLTIAHLKTGIITVTHTTGSTATYTLPTGTLTDAGVSMAVGDSFDWVLINLSIASADTVTVAAGVDHTIVGKVIVLANHGSTGALYGNTALFRTRKTAANTFVTYCLA